MKARAFAVCLLVLVFVPNCSRAEGLSFASLEAAIQSLGGAAVVDSAGHLATSPSATDSAIREAVLRLTQEKELLDLFARSSNVRARVEFLSVMSRVNEISTREDRFTIDNAEGFGRSSKFGDRVPKLIQGAAVSLFKLKERKADFEDRKCVMEQVQMHLLDGSVPSVHEGLEKVSDEGSCQLGAVKKLREWKPLASLSRARGEHVYSFNEIAKLLHASLDAEIEDLEFEVSIKKEASLWLAFASDLRNLQKYSDAQDIFESFFEEDLKAAYEIYLRDASRSAEREKIRMAIDADRRTKLTQQVLAYGTGTLDERNARVESILGQEVRRQYLNRAYLYLVRDRLVLKPDLSRHLASRAKVLFAFDQVIDMVNPRADWKNPADEVLDRARDQILEVGGFIFGGALIGAAVEAPLQAALLPQVRNILAKALERRLASATIDRVAGIVTAIPVAVTGGSVVYIVGAGLETPIIGSQAWGWDQWLRTVLLWGGLRGGNEVFQYFALKPLAGALANFGVAGEWMTGAASVVSSPSLAALSFTGLTRLERAIKGEEQPRKFWSEYLDNLLPMVEMEIGARVAGVVLRPAKVAERPKAPKIVRFPVEQVHSTKPAARIDPALAQYVVTTEAGTFIRMFRGMRPEAYERLRSGTTAGKAEYLTPTRDSAEEFGRRHHSEKKKGVGPVIVEFLVPADQVRQLMAHQGAGMEVVVYYNWGANLRPEWIVSATPTSAGVQPRAH